MTTAPSIWTDTPPKEPGTYWLLGRNSGAETIGRSMNTDLYRFGPRIPSAEELAGLYAAAAELAEIKRVWGMGDTKGGA